jgi:hypothetical protein
LTVFGKKIVMRGGRAGTLFLTNVLTVAALGFFFVRPSAARQK